MCNEGMVCDVQSAKVIQMVWWFSVNEWMVPIWISFQHPLLAITGCGSCSKFPPNKTNF